MTEPKTFISWSSGKDAAMALYRSEIKPNLLFTTVNQHYQRVSMHGLRISLLEKQAKAMDLPLLKIELPEEPSMKEYEEALMSVYQQMKKEGYTHGIFGDIFLEDLKDYREKQLQQVGFQGVFPIWRQDTRSLILDFINAGFRAKLVAIKSELLDQSYLGRDIDLEFLETLPSNVDPCGENGEFHTFCYDGPVFREAIHFEIGEARFREYPDPTGEKKGMGFWFLDLELGDR